MDNISNVIAEAINASASEDAVKNKIRASQAANHNCARNVLLWTLVSCTCLCISGFVIVTMTFFYDLITHKESYEGTLDFLKKALEWGLVACATTFLSGNLKKFWGD